MYVHIFGYLVNKLEIWWVYLSPIENIKLNNDIKYNLLLGFHMSNFIFHELSMQLIIELLLTFNRSIKPTTRFLTKILLYQFIMIQH